MKIAERMALRTSNLRYISDSNTKVLQDRIQKIKNILESESQKKNKHAKKAKISSAT